MGEGTICRGRDVKLAFLYARSVIKGRWEEAEPYIMSAPALILPYAKDVIKGRWYEAERCLADYSDLSKQYVKEMIKIQIPILSFVE
jgi:hypothetical protein